MRSSAVETLIQAAWRRRLFVLTFEQLAFALLIVCSGVIVMLVIGTQILDWYWLLLLAVIGAAITGWRIRHRLLRRYEVARLIDKRLQLKDSLSTAWFLLAESPGENRPAARYQIRQAEEIASGIAAESAFPVVLDKMWIAASALLIVILGLFAARYLVNDSLSLKPALIHLPMSAARNLTASGSPAKPNPPKTETRGDQQMAREILSPQSRDGQPNASTQQAAAQNAQTDSKSDQNASAGSGKSSSRPDDTPSASRDGAQNSAQSDAANSAGDSKPGQGSKEANNAQQDKGRGQPKTADGQQTPGLMDKMRDALSGLMAKLQRSSATDSASRDSKSSSGSQKGQNQDPAGKKQSAAPDQTGQKAESSLDSQSSAQAAAQEKTPASSIGSSNEQMPQSKTNDPQSGAGRQDGEKDIKQAEQLKAMGKLAEIIGKRSANLTGEIKVDKPSKEQQLETQYSNEVGHHTDSGGEINRDEVPLEYQSYVRAYMKEIHKQANAK